MPAKIRQSSDMNDMNNHLKFKYFDLSLLPTKFTDSERINLKRIPTNNTSSINKCI